MTDHECPKAFYCLPESCGDCPRDQQDEQARHHWTLVGPHCRCHGCASLRAEGERAERERIIGILKTVQAIDYNAPIGEQPYMVIGCIIDKIRDGEHE